LKHLRQELSLSNAAVELQMAVAFERMLPSDERVTRGPNWPNAPAGQDGGDLDQLEELGDDAIIAQQTAAHAPQPRQNVASEARSIVISDRPSASDPEGAQPKRRASSEKTVIIRDRRKLDEMRNQLIARQLKKKQERARTLYFWGAVGLAAFVLGGVVALFATGDRAPAASNEAPLVAPAPQQPAEPAAAEPADPSGYFHRLPINGQSRAIPRPEDPKAHRAARSRRNPSR
jgi:hypothetical protein